LKQKIGWGSKSGVPETAKRQKRPKRKRDATCEKRTQQYFHSQYKYSQQCAFRRKRKVDTYLYLVGTKTVGIKTLRGVREAQQRKKHVFGRHLRHLGVTNTSLRRKSVRNRLSQTSGEAGMCSIEPQPPHVSAVNGDGLKTISELGNKTTFCCCRCVHIYSALISSASHVVWSKQYRRACEYEVVGDGR
jgi:hypothetical protein